MSIKDHLTICSQYLKPSGVHVYETKTVLFSTFNKVHVYSYAQTGHAYHCFCSDRRLNLMRKTMRQHGEIPQYDNKCRSLTSQQVRDNLDRGTPYVVRLKVSIIVLRIVLYNETIVLLNSRVHFG